MLVILQLPVSEKFRRSLSLTCLPSRITSPSKLTSRLSLNARNMSSRSATSNCTRRAIGLPSNSATTTAAPSKSCRDSRSNLTIWPAMWAFKKGLFWRSRWAPSAKISAELSPNTKCRSGTLEGLTAAHERRTSIPCPCFTNPEIASHKFALTPDGATSSKYERPPPPKPYLIPPLPRASRSLTQ